LSHPVTSNPIGHPFTVLPTVESTNNYAMAQVQSGLAFHGAAWFAREQTAGKGQRGKHWITTPNENIMLSVVIYPGLPASSQFMLSASVALACYDLCKKYAGDETRIKWPNDIYWRDRKAGGILIESSFRGAEWLFAIVGIGININQTQFDPAAPNPVSLKQVTGKTFNPEELARELCEALEHRYRAMQNETTDSLIQQYEQVLYKRNETVWLKKQGTPFKTTIQGITSTGRLMTADTIEREFDFGEVEWITTQNI
jgi:BirA family transcriptional regulator, biotin operon repressor / biotin---[acetyl-CoA-carboxylase] ligase